MYHTAYTVNISLKYNKMAATTTESTVAEMEETVARISSHKGVEGVIIMDRRGTYGIDRYTVCFVNSECALTILLIHTYSRS